MVAGRKYLSQKSPDMNRTNRYGSEWAQRVQPSENLIIKTAQE